MFQKTKLAFGEQKNIVNIDRQVDEKLSMIDWETTVQKQKQGKGQKALQKSQRVKELKEPLAELHSISEDFHFKVRTDRDVLKQEIEATVCSYTVDQRDEDTARAIHQIK